VWRIDDAKRPAATLIAEETAVVPGGGAPVPGGWKPLTSNVLGDPGYATYDFCTGQRWYDVGIYTPTGHPDTVFVLGSTSTTSNISARPMSAPCCAPRLPAILTLITTT
jgi:hypothetical protein